MEDKLKICYFTSMFLYCGLNFFSLAFEANCENTEQLGSISTRQIAFHTSQTWELRLSYRP